MRTGAAIAVAMLALLFCGCVESSTVVTVASDGSGTIRRTFLVRKDSLVELQGTLASVLSGEKDVRGQIDVDVDLFDAPALEKKGGEYGESVSLVSCRRVSSQSHEGYEAVYRFPDVNSVRVNLRQGAQGPDEGQILRFSFRRGDPSTLAVRRSFGSPRPIIQAQSSPPSLQEDGLLKGLKVYVAVEVEGTLLHTDARYREGDRVVLADIGFDRLITAADCLERIAASVSEGGAALSDLPGVRIDPREEITILFR